MIMILPGRCLKDNSIDKKVLSNIIAKFSVYKYYMQVCDYQLVLDRKLFQETFKRHKSYPK